MAREILIRRLHGAEVDFGVRVGRFDGSDQLRQGVFLAAYGLENQAVALDTYFHEVIDAHAQALQHRGGQTDGCTVSPFAYDSSHFGGSLGRFLAGISLTSFDSVSTGTGSVPLCGKLQRRRLEIRVSVRTLMTLT